eukprot:62155-Pyramimonas_sp.AAC.1
MKVLLDLAIVGEDLASFPAIASGSRNHWISNRALARQLPSAFLDHLNTNRARSTLLGPFT